MLSLHQCGDQLITWVGSDAVCLCRARRSGIETSGVGSVGHRRRADKRSLIRFDAEHSTSGVRPQEQSVCPHKRRLRVSAVRRVVIVVVVVACSEAVTVRPHIRVKSCP